jgi:hypothetical protein
MTARNREKHEVAKTGQFGRFSGEMGPFSEKIDKNRKKTRKIEVNFEVVLLIMNGLSAVLRQK